MKRLLASPAFSLCAAVLVMAAFAVAGCETPSGDAPGSEPAAPLNAEAQNALAALPAQARLLAVADAQAMRRSGFFDRHAQNAFTGESGARLSDFFDATGFSPREDVRKVYLAAPAGRDEPPQIALAADFDRARLQEQLASEAWRQRFEQSMHRDQAVYRRRPEGGDGKPFAFALTADGLILLSSPTGVHQMLDRLANGGVSVAENDGLMRLADRVRGRGDTWFVAQGVPGLHVGAGTRGNAGGLPQRFQRLEQVVRQAAGAVSLTDDATADGTLFLYTTENAAPSDLREVLEGIVSGLGRRDSLPDRQRRALDAVEIEEEGDAVRVRFSLPMEK